MTIHQQITRLLNQIDEQTRIMKSICEAAGKELPENLTGVSKEAWQAEFKVRQHLTQQLYRIQSILASVDQYIFVNCD